jgi:elongation factor P
MISLAQLKKGQTIILEEQPYIVVEYSHHKKGRGGAVLRTKLKHLKNENVIEHTFQGNDKIKPADLSRKKVQFLYSDESGANFMDENYEQFNISLDVLSDVVKYLKDGQSVDVAYLDNNPVSVQLPPKVELKVIEAPPAVKGDTANSATKTIKLETGLTVQAPLFVAQEDVVRVNTETGEYLERV